MKVRVLIKWLQGTSPDNEVRLLNSSGTDKGDYTPDLYVSFDDAGDVLIYDI